MYDWCGVAAYALKRGLKAVWNRVVVDFFFFQAEDGIRDA